jgi:DNA-binding transcriptional regulator YhcF (GntR family)
MTIPTYSRNKPEGRAHRDKIARWILPRLTPGCRVPSANWMARFLGISSSEGGRQIRRALDEAGVVTETRGVGRGRRIYVVSMGERP